ncbi:DUF2259 domain-containing protein [Mesorhizobium sp. CAU 1741]|uniref:DUF2259 domain-containing protein n=1 Tax=Mesorhizobium sp. CAU 1741 TaxID=3140366 RepID=UPI00325A5D39
MKRFAALLLALAILPLSLSARAGDAAELNILGFSADGGVFAFEEYGIQDGSGFPYANRFYIDTATDAFLPGTPIRVRIDDEAASLEDARAEARTSGEAIVSEAELAANRGTTAGYNAITELSADPHRMTVNPRKVMPPIDQPVEFRLDEIPFEASQTCEPFGPAMGFRLVRTGLEPGKTAALLHEDTSIPASRNCALGYRIGAVQTFFPEAGDPVFAVLISVRSFGFEGPDHRWIALPGRL